MTQPCTMDPAFALGLEAYELDGRQPSTSAAPGTAPRRPEPLDPKLADMAHRLRHDAGDLRERACRLPFGARRHRLFKAALNADSAALEIEAWPEAAEIDAANAAFAAHRSHRHG